MNRTDKVFMWSWVYVLKTRALFVFLMALSLTAMGASAGSGSGQYQLGPGDKIRILVYGEDDLTIETLVGDSGTISYPFLGEVDLRGKTVSGLEQYITSKLKGDYLVNPEITVSILEYRDFYVNGHVEKPGGFPFQPGMTVRKAISLAGGFGERANKEKISVVPGDNPNAPPEPIGLEDSIRPGDIITVDRSFF